MREKYSNIARAFSLDMLEQYTKDPRGFRENFFFLQKQSMDFLEVIDLYFTSVKKDLVGSSFVDQMYTLAQKWTSGETIGLPFRRRAYRKSHRVKIKTVKSKFFFKMAAQQAFTCELEIQKQDKCHGKLLHVNGVEAYAKWHALAPQEKTLYQRKAREASRAAYEFICAGSFPKSWEDEGNVFLRKFVQGTNYSCEKFGLCSKSNFTNAMRDYAVDTIKTILFYDSQSKVMRKCIEENGMEIEFIKSFMPTIDTLYYHLPVERKIVVIAILWGRFKSTFDRLKVSQVGLSLLERSSVGNEQSRGSSVFYEKHCDTILKKFKSNKEICAKFFIATRWAVLPPRIQASYIQNASKYDKVDTLASLAKVFQHNLKLAEKVNVALPNELYEEDMTNREIQKKWDDIPLLEKLSYEMRSKSISQKTKKAVLKCQRMGSFSTLPCDKVHAPVSPERTMFKKSDHEMNIDRFLE